MIRLGRSFIQNAVTRSSVIITDPAKLVSPSFHRCYIQSWISTINRLQKYSQDHSKNTVVDQHHKMRDFNRIPPPVVKTTVGSDEETTVDKYGVETCTR